MCVCVCVCANSQLYVLCAKSAAALRVLLAKGLLTATAAGVASGKERVGGERGDNGNTGAAACVALGMGGAGLDGGSLSHRMSAAAATAALSQDGLPPIALWIAGRDDALPLALLLVRLMEAGHPSPPPPAAARAPATATATATATAAAAAAGGRLWGSLADGGGEESSGRRGRERAEGAAPATPAAAGTETQGSSKRAGKTAAKAAAAPSSSAAASRWTLACSDQQWGDAVFALVPALLAAMSATDAGRPAPPWRSSALGLVERLVAAVRAPEVLAAPEAAARAAALSAAFVAFAQVRFVFMSVCDACGSVSDDGLLPCREGVTFSHPRQRVSRHTVARPSSVCTPDPQSLCFDTVFVGGAREASGTSAVVFTVR